MYVRKFEADTIEDALKDIKRELGPDAIILKTISNKGLKGAFKKKKIEITAAISEKTYTKKANVDAVLNPEEKSEFYQGSSSYISNMIDRMDNGREKMNASQKNKYSSSYGDMSLNRNVKVDRSEKIDKAISKMTHGGLEQFLSVDEEPKVDKNFSLNQSLSSFDFDNENEKLNHNHFLKKSQSQNSSKDIQGKKINRYIDQEDDQFDDHNEELENAYGRGNTQGDLGYSFQSNNQASQQEIIELSENFKEYAEMQKAKIESLEKKLYEMTKVVHKFQKPEANGIFQLRQLLRSHGVHNEYVTKIIKKATFELSESELDNSEVVLEFAFREMQNAIHVALPKFAKTVTAPSVTIFLSESMTGQSSLIKKICAGKSDSVIINN